MSVHGVPNADAAEFRFQCEVIALPVPWCRVRLTMACKDRQQHADGRKTKTYT